MDSEQDRAACNLRIGQRIRHLRAARGLSIRALAAQAGVTPATISRWESGSTEVGVASAFALAKAFSIDLVTLLGPTAYAKPSSWPFDLSDFDALFDFAATVEEAALELRESASPAARKALEQSAERVRMRRSGGGGQTHEGQ